IEVKLPSMNSIKLPPKPPMKPVSFSIKDYGPISKTKSSIPPVPPMPGNIKNTNELKSNVKVIPAKDIKGVKKIFVKCDRCDKTFIIDLPRRLVLSNPQEVVPVTLLHADDHALTVYLDRNFESRRDYISEIFVLKEYKSKLLKNAS
ncbi:MAG: hypothetical protein ACTSWN_07880, partial [Promethearchaeota archaeon]